VRQFVKGGNEIQGNCIYLVCGVDVALQSLRSILSFAKILSALEILTLLAVTGRLLRHARRTFSSGFIDKVLT
jgi:hypothetical protein